jgi:hypothetical protein
LAFMCDLLPVSFNFKRFWNSSKYKVSVDSVIIFIFMAGKLGKPGTTNSK